MLPMRSGLTSPAAMVVAATPNDPTTCGGTVTANAGSDTISFTGGTVAASDTCTVQVDVTAPTAGTSTRAGGCLLRGLWGY
jgi:hypothetical protein